MSETVCFPSEYCFQCFDFWNARLIHFDALWFFPHVPAACIYIFMQITEVIYGMTARGDLN